VHRAMFAALVEAPSNEFFKRYADSAACVGERGRELARRQRLGAERRPQPAGGGLRHSLGLREPAAALLPRGRPYLDMPDGAAGPRLLERSGLRQLQPSRTSRQPTRPSR
jgi:hypothetical protein